MTLHATLRRDRSTLGTLEARTETGRVGGPWECLGKADGATAAANANPTRSPLKKYGDTPTGTYAVTVAPAPASVRTYGGNPVVMLAAKSGQCVQAVIKGGRAGLWLHGGALNVAGKLRPTYGCIRVHDETMAEIHALAAEYGHITELTVTEE